jgi:hypothetical protein
MPDYPNPGTMEMLTIADTALSLTSTYYAPTTGKCAGSQVFYALISVTGADVRYTMDGTTPVGATTGHLLAAGDSIFVSGKIAIMRFKAIRDASTSALMAVTYFF